MADRPIIFSAPMVRALLEGRKTQTRRVLRHKSIGIGIAPTADGDHATWIQFHHPKGGPLTCVKWPYAPGDRLWVREAWSGAHYWRGTKPADRVTGCYGGDVLVREDLWYWADGSPDVGDFEPPRPSIHMPRWASRLTLTVTDVLVQRLQEISNEDAVAEGCPGWYRPMHPDHGETDGQMPWEAYADLWNSLHGPDAWAANPWVAAVSFTVRHGNIDAGGDHA